MRGTWGDEMIHFVSDHMRLFDQKIQQLSHEQN